MISDYSLTAFNTLQAIAGLSATINRSGATCPAVIVPSNPDSEAQPGRTGAFGDEMQELLIAVSDYKPSGTKSDPQDGDQLAYVEFVGGPTTTVELRPPADSQLCFKRWPGGAVFLVHSKVISRV